MNPVRLIILTATLLLAGVVNAEEEKILNVFNWADYIGETTLEDFEAEFGIKVNYDVYTSTEVVEAKLLAGRTGYDVVVHAVRYSARLLPIGVYQPLDRSKLTLWGNLDPWVMEVMARYDPGNKYGINYMWGTTGFAYNERMVKERMPDAPVDSGDMLFNPEVVSRLADCGVTYLDEPTDVIPLALLYLGHDPNSMEPEHLATVEALLKSIRPYLRYFSSAKLINDLPNEEVCVAMAWSGDAVQAMRRVREVGADIQLVYSVPKQGTVVWFDGLFIPSDAPHPDNAHLFLNYLLRPEVIAPITDLTGYANGNLASIPFIDPEISQDPASYPPKSQLRNLNAGEIFGPKLERRRTRAWSRIKTGL